MKLRFNGAQGAKVSGCPVCGRKQTSESVTFTKSFILPSGQMKTFRTGREYEVSDRDGNFLLSYVYRTKEGTVRPSFEKV